MPADVVDVGHDVFAEVDAHVAELVARCRDGLPNTAGTAAGRRHGRRHVARVLVFLGAVAKYVVVRRRCLVDGRAQAPAAASPHCRGDVVGHARHTAAERSAFEPTAADAASSHVSMFRRQPAPTPLGYAFFQPAFERQPPATRC